VKVVNHKSDFWMKFIVEHLEEELFPWCIIEYSRAALAVGRENLLVSRLVTRQAEFESAKESFLDLQLPMERICLLDSESQQPLMPEDIIHFDYVLVGGILGNVDEFDMDRTAILRQCGLPGRHLGHLQMTTDTAVKVAHLILHEQISFDRLRFVDRPELTGPTGQKFISDFRYLQLPDGAPDIDPRIVAEMERDFDLDQLE
jgi:ribosome biogenesis SPOUT family RNA methylase Rps3